MLLTPKHDVAGATGPWGKGVQYKLGIKILKTTA